MNNEDTISKLIKEIKDKITEFKPRDNCVKEDCISRLDELETVLYEKCPLFKNKKNK